MTTEHLQRTVFTKFRLGEYFTERELVVQTGASRAHWPRVIVKELVDNNALDACENDGIPPEIAVRVQNTPL